jgi:hypothetical protein
MGKGKTFSNLCPDCITKLTTAFDAETENPNILLSMILAFGAAVLSALIWYGAVVITKYKLGIVAIVVGIIVALAAMFGAGKKRGLPIQLISVLFTVFAMVSSEYFIVRYFAVQALALEGITDIPLFLPLGTAVDIIRFSISEDPLTLLFWAIAAFEAFSIPAKQKLRFGKPAAAS